MQATVVKFCNTLQYININEEDKRHISEALSKCNMYYQQPVICEEIEESEMEDLYDCYEDYYNCNIHVSL